eukprot:TRINITY_DN4569_c0_g1_i1.p1 TRINITY_DN4569_c0_g1~~TRINITY_DN4569_c0_g1_i1.p1  ORF type:complete len:473 (+),score=146.34 TRINITY_DN4569_c0_g1_i1:67-1485(+)
MYKLQPAQKFALGVGAFQLIIFLLFTFGTKYNGGIDMKNSDPEQVAKDAAMYPLLQDVNVMIFIGFGLLMSFLRKYSLSSIGVAFLVAALIVQWGSFVAPYVHHAWEDADNMVHKIEFGLENLLEGEFAAAVALITMGGLLGKVSSLQMLVLGMIEVVCYAINFNIVAGDPIYAADVGGTMVIHAFGAYFGLAASRVLTQEKAKDHEDNSSIYHSDFFACIGTIFLWIFWPSFAAALAEGQMRILVICHCLICLAASCVTTFILSKLMQPHKVFGQVEVQNATLAGGVAIGCVGNMAIGMGGAVFVGFCAGTVSVIGYLIIQPLLEKKIGLYDTCGINNLHGMPAITGAILSVFFTAIIDKDEYGTHLGDVFPKIAEEDGRSRFEQAMCQLAGIVVTLIFAIVTGTLSGYAVKWGLNSYTDKQLFQDDTEMHVPDDFHTIAGEKTEEEPIIAAATEEEKTENPTSEDVINAV